MFLKQACGRATQECMKAMRSFFVHRDGSTIVKERKAGEKENAMANNKKNNFFLSFVSATLVMAGAIDAAGQSVAPVNPRFSEWQKRKAVDNASQNGQIDNATNLTKGTSARRAAAASVDSEEIGLGLVPDIMDMDYLADINAGVARAPVGGFPASYDLRAQGMLTDVRDQNPYGTCWAFATMASLESGILGREGLATDFSENNLANLHGWDYNGFIEGGNATMAMAYLTRWGGPVNETDDPYPAIAGSVALAPVRHVQRVVWIPGKTDSLDNDAIKEAIMEHGALFATYCHSSSYYNPSTSSYHYTGKSPANHAVAIVGWDDGYPASNFAVRPSGNGAYLVRNSWGASWGNGGYFWVSYFDKVFARSTMYAFSSAEPTDNYGKIYQHDQLGMVSAFSVNWGANVFTATDADSIAAVGFYALAPNTGYSISIYTRCQAGRPTSGTCALTQSGTIPEPGFTTIPLSSVVPVTSGSRFSVVLRLTTPGYGYPHAIEYAYTGITSGATASSGQSFYSSNGSSWTDLTSWNSTANLCIKAYTASAVAAPTLASIAIAGPATVKSGETAAYTCTARYSDNSEKTVSPAWTLPSGSDYASINAAGTLAAYDTTTGRSVVICATYAEDGVTKTAEMAVVITAAPPSAPTGLTATQGEETRAVRLSWAAVPGAENYSVYRGMTAATANAQYLGVAEGNKYSDTTAVPGRDYWYFVKARNGSGTGPFSDGANGWRALSAPADIAASDGASEASVAVSWSPVEGAAAYMVWRSEGFDAEPTALSGWLSATEFADATAVPGTDYWYSVSAATDATGLRPSERGVPDDGFRAIPVVPEALAIDGDASIPAGGTASYSAYVLYSDGHRGESPASPTWAVSTGTVSRTGVVTAPVVAANTETILSASTTIEGVHVSGEKRIVVTAVVPAAPANLRVVSATAAGGVALAWDAVPGASAYTLTRAAGADGSSVEFATTDSTSFIDTAAIPGLLYTYGVAAANAVGTGPQSVAVTATIPLAAPTGVSATIDRTDCVRVSWGAVMGATHYHVARADSEDGAKTELGTWTDALSFDDTMAVADTTVFYFVKAATDATGANASAWSDAVQGMRKPERVLVSLTISGPERVPSGDEAVYVCTAAYSDGTTPKVAPAWAATLGAIGADGKFTAPSVTSVATATVTASYGGLLSEYDVTIVAPVVERTAEITTVTAAQRWPFSGLVDINYTLATAPAGTKATVSVSATDEDHNAVLPATTLSGDGADGSPVEAGSHRITWDLAADHPGFHAASVAVSVSAVPAISVTVTFDGNGGVPSRSTLSGVVGKAYGLLPTATRDGYGFAGWFTAASEGTQVTATSLFDENVTTLYAHWTANDRQIYGVTFENAVNDTEGSMNDFAYTLGPIVGQGAWTSGWDDLSEVVHGHGGRCLQLQTEGETLTNKLNVATASTLQMAAAKGGAYLETDVKFVPSDTIESGLVGGDGGSMFGLFAYAADGGNSINLVVFHAYFDADMGAVAYTNEVFDISISEESFTRVRIEMKRMNGLNLFSVSIDGMTVTSSSAYQGDRWFLAADSTASGAGRGASSGGTAGKRLVIIMPATLIAFSNYDTLCFKGTGMIDNICIGTIGEPNDKVQLWEGGPYWATTNVGADNPEDFGLYFWWGDTVGYQREGDAWVANDGSSSSFSFSEGNTPTYGKDNATLQSEGWITADGVLSPAHDAAHVHWGGSWRMPTQQELSDLDNNCDWTSTMRNGVNGYVVRGRGGFSEASIFLPGAGYGYGTSLYNAGSGGSCWSSVPYSYNNYDFSRLLDFGNGNHLTSNYYRYGGLSVRPVQGGTDVEAETYVMTLDAQGGSGGTTSVIATNGAAMPTITIPTRDGYTFGGYWTGVDGAGTQYYTASGASARTCDLTADTTLYAKWAANDANSTYLVIDLSGGADATNYPVSYLASVPEGGWTDEYKTTKRVLRRIEPGTFTMGSPEEELGHSQNETQHEVTLTKPFYIGVFEVTQSQWHLIMGTLPSSYTTDGVVSLPVENVSWNDIRGDSCTYNWPCSSNVLSSSFMGRLRFKCGQTFDLPTEAQWEYACRAGTTTSLNSGKNIANVSSDAGMDEVGRYFYNKNDGKGYMHAVVGSYLPNAWGLYDMHGNVLEWCLDWYGDYPSSATTDPEGPQIGTARVLRSGLWDAYANQCRSASRSCDEPTDEGSWYVGFRLVCSANAVRGQQICVTFNGNGGMPSIVSKTGFAGHPFEELPTATRTDYVFAGWFTDPIDGTIVTETSLMDASVRTLYAHWTANANYLVVDLADGMRASHYPVTYLNAPPEGGFNTDEYKTTKLVLRRIEPGTFIMGSPTNEIGRWDLDDNKESQHLVTLTRPFYIGVFEVTQRQWERVMGDWPSYFENASYRDCRPVENVTWKRIRGSMNWPSETNVLASSFIGVLREKTGQVFDLPTEAQWEYACRANTTTAFNNGTNLGSTSTSDSTMNALGRYHGNNGVSGYYKRDCATNEGTDFVGRYLPNAWGLYDMHGNVYEWCLDWWHYDLGSADATDPVGPSSPDLTDSIYSYSSDYKRVVRGGSCADDARSCRSGRRGSYQYESSGFSVGLRLSLTVQ